MNSYDSVVGKITKKSGGKYGYCKVEYNFPVLFQ